MEFDPEAMVSLTFSLNIYIAEDAHMYSMYGRILDCGLPSIKNVGDWLGFGDGIIKVHDLRGCWKVFQIIHHVSVLYTHSNVKRSTICVWSPSNSSRRPTGRKILKAAFLAPMVNRARMTSLRVRFKVKFPPEPSHPRPNLQKWNS